MHFKGKGEQSEMRRKIQDRGFPLNYASHLRFKSTPVQQCTFLNVILLCLLYKCQICIYEFAIILNMALVLFTYGCYPVNRILSSLPRAGLDQIIKPVYL